MTNHKNYLSDEELECLMCEIESKDLVFAPPDIQEQVLNVLDETLHVITERSNTDKIREFKRYRFRVLATVAAAVVAVFVLPRVENLQQHTMPEKPSAKQDFLKKGRYKTKEEANNFEKWLIKMLNARNPQKGYNLTDGGEGTVGIVRSDEWKRKQKSEWTLQAR